MTTKGEAFAGLSVAITTPFNNGEVDYKALREQVEFQIAAGTTCLVPMGTTGEGHAGHRFEQHCRSAAADAVGRQGRRRRRADRRPLLQQAHPDRLLRTL